MNAVIGEEITAGSTDDTDLTITNAPRSSTGNRVPIEHLIRVVSGTIKFGKGSVHANAHGYGADEILIITCPNGDLHFQASSANDVFVITV